MPLETLADSSRQRPSGSLEEFSPYPPIADYAFLSDCEVTALVAPSGSVEWMCLPKMDSPSVFGAMLDRDAGWFRFGPTCRSEIQCAATGAPAARSSSTTT